MTKETCGKCAHCCDSYKGGFCEIRQKKVKLSDRCDRWEPKRR